MGSKLAASEDPEPKRLRDAVGRALLGLLKLVGVFVPEILIGLAGAVVGLVAGIVVGAVLTESLFAGSGAWGRAGPIALVIPALTALGPPLVGLTVGLVGPPMALLGPHALMMALVARTRWRDRYVVLFASAALAWLPPLICMGDGPSAMLAAAVIFSPLTASIGFGAGALFVAARGVLDGRTLVDWWRVPDGSMVLALVVLTTYSSLIVWFICFLFCLLPTVPIAAAIALAASARLLAVGKHRALALTCGAVNLLHAGLIVFAVFAWALD